MKFLINLVMLLSVALLPIYMWSSGGMQISHFLLLAFCALVFMRQGVRINAPGKLLGLLVVYVSICVMFFVFSNQSAERLIPILYMIFVWVVFVGTRQWFLAGENVRPFVIGLLVSGIVAVAGVMAMGYGATLDAEGYRSVGTFNNPNQLGYFAVCLLSVAGLLHNKKAVSPALLLGFSAIALFLAIASLSKAAMISCGFASILIGFVLSRSRLQFVMGLAIAFSLVIVAVWLVDSGSLDQYKFVQRLSGLGSQGDDSAAGRGYGVFAHADALQLFFGFGAERVRDIVGHELHSTVGSFFANYGVLGGLLFTLFLLKWAALLYRSIGLIGLIVVGAPPMLYGLTHNGSRFSIFWLLVGLSFALCAKTMKSSPNSSRAANVSSQIGRHSS